MGLDEAPTPSWALEYWWFHTTGFLLEAVTCD